MIPDWMMETRAEPFTSSTAVDGGKGGFVEKSIGGIIDFFQESLRSEGYAKRDGLLQSLDPRVKLVSIVLLIFAVSMTQDVGVLLVMYCMTLIAAYFSNIEVSYFIKRVWVFVPIFALIIMIPVMFNVFMPGTPLVTIFTTGSGVFLGPFTLPGAIYITREGTRLAVIFTVRVATCVSLAVLLFLTTKRDVLFRSLRTLRIPKVFVLTLDMCYRYIFLFSDMVKDFYLAKKSRSVKRLPLMEEQKWVGGRIGYTLVRSIAMSEKVHKAMISRGFKGDVKLMENFTIRRRDYFALTSALICSGILILLSQQILRL